MLFLALLILKLVMALPLLVLHVVVAENVAVRHQHEILVENVLLIRLVQIPILLVPQVSNLSYIHVGHHGIIKRGSRFKFKLDYHPMTRHFLIFSFHDNLIKVHLNLRVLELYF